jgi:hypothetical protein
MMKTDNDVIVNQLSKASAITVILDTLKEASLKNSPFEFEFEDKDRKDVYYVAHMQCYKTTANGVSLHNISELALVVISKMCMPNRFTINTSAYSENREYFKQHDGFNLLKMGLLSFTNVEQSANAQHNSMSVEYHEERLRNLAILELMTALCISGIDMQWTAHYEKKNALVNISTV